MLAVCARRCRCSPSRCPPAAGARPQTGSSAARPHGDRAMPFMAGLEIALQGAGDDEPGRALRRLADRRALGRHRGPLPGRGARRRRALLRRPRRDEPQRRDRRPALPWADGFVPTRYATGNGGYDVGLIQLGRPAPAAAGAPAARRRDRACGRPARRALTAGWGCTEDTADGGALSTDAAAQGRPAHRTPTPTADRVRRRRRSAALDFSTEICALAPEQGLLQRRLRRPAAGRRRHGGLPALVGAVSFGIGSGDLAARRPQLQRGPARRLQPPRRRPAQRLRPRAGPAGRARRRRRDARARRGRHASPRDPNAPAAAARSAATTRSPGTSTATAPSPRRGRAHGRRCTLGAGAADGRRARDDRGGRRRGPHAAHRPPRPRARSPSPRAGATARGRPHGPRVARRAASGTGGGTVLRSTGPQASRRGAPHAAASPARDASQRCRSARRRERRRAPLRLGSATPATSSPARGHAEADGQAASTCK